MEDGNKYDAYNYGVPEEPDKKEEPIEDWKMRIKDQKGSYINLPMNKEEYEKFLASEKEIANLDMKKVDYEKRLATMTKLEQDKKDLLKAIENERNDIESFYSNAKDELEEEGLAEKLLDEIDGFENHLVLIDPLKKPSDENKEKIEEFCKKIRGVA